MGSKQGMVLAFQGMMDMQGSLLTTSNPEDIVIVKGVGHYVLLTCEIFVALHTLPLGLWFYYMVGCAEIYLVERIWLYNTCVFGCIFTDMAVCRRIGLLPLGRLFGGRLYDCGMNLKSAKVGVI